MSGLFARSTTKDVEDSQSCSSIDVGSSQTGTSTLARSPSMLARHKDSMKSRFSLPFALEPVTQNMGAIEASKDADDSGASNFKGVLAQELSSYMADAMLKMSDSLGKLGAVE